MKPNIELKENFNLFELYINNQFIMIFTREDLANGAKQRIIAALIPNNEVTNEPKQ